MSNQKSVFLVLGATGQTGQHFVSLALQAGHTVRVLVRSPDKLEAKGANLELRQGSIDEFEKIEELLPGTDYVVAMLGDAHLQKHHNICTDLVKQLIPAMRKHSVKRFLYQAGGFTKPYDKPLPFMSWILKNTIARYGGLLGQHRDNEAVLKHLVEEASDIAWIVHRASIISNGPTKGILARSTSKFNLVTFVDCATYNYQLLSDESAVHTYDLSHYVR